MRGTDSYHISIDLLAQTGPDTTPHNDYRVSELTVCGFDSQIMDPQDIQGNSHEPLKARLLGKGAIRLFRDFDDGRSLATAKTSAVDSRDDTMLSIIALPTYFTAADLLGFVGDYYMEHVTHIRILKSEKPNRFLVLLKFKEALRAAEFQYYFDGKPFNSMEPEACHVVFVRSVTVDVETEREVLALNSLIPFFMQDPFTAAEQLPDEKSGPRVSPKPGDHLIPIELPTCPVCLERLDCEVSGLLTIPCQHTFHCQCLSKWGDDTCPVCRYTNSISNHNIRRSVRRLLQMNSRMHFQQQQFLQGFAGESPHAVETSEDVDTCGNCSITDNLWVCLICGNLGCSRYAPEQHLLKHFVESGHCFAMELATSRVWDYAGDSYVHRLITSESDGKIVEFPNKASAEEKPGSKLEGEGAEYSELLLSQLISQREYYELLLKDKIQNTGARRRSSAIEAGGDVRRITELEQRVEDLMLKLEKVTANVIPALKQKIDMKQVSLTVAAQELQESNALTEGLLQKVEFLTAENEKLKALNEDLGDQVKDLMFYLESLDKFKDQPPEVTEGQVIMRPKKKSSKSKK